jgi:hypothetical protein
VTRALAALAAALALCGGCQHELRRTVADIDRAYAAGDFPRASRLAEDAAARNDDDRQDRLLWWLEAGRARQAEGSLDRAAEWYDRAFEEVRPYLDSKAEATVTEAVATTAVNQTIRIYRATPPERIMLCTLQAANFLGRHDLARTRIELNRAMDFQQDAVARFADAVNAAQEAANRDWQSRGWSSSVSADAVGRVRTEQGRDPVTLGRASFANPFASYLRAAFLLATSSDAGDRQNARADLRAVQEMVPGLASPAADIALVDSGAAHASLAQTWVFVLTGLAPDYREFRLDIPIPVGNVNYVSAAFPVLRRRGDFVPAVLAHSGAGERSERLADLDAMVEADFDARLPLIVTQEIVSSAGKAAATWAASQAAYQQDSTTGAIVQIMGIIYQAASTAADLRCWSTMPKQVLLLRVPTPADGRLPLLREDGTHLCTLAVEPGSPNIALVTVPSAAARAPGVILYRGGDVHGPPAPQPPEDFGPPAPTAAPGPA